MINPSAFRFGPLDFVDMQRLVERPVVRQPEPAQSERVAVAAVLFVLGGAMAALKSWR